jgi:hypothetical protein
VFIRGQQELSVIIAVTCIVAILVILYILGVRPKDLPAPEPVSPFAHLDERKAAIYENLRDLQFEYRLGKLSDADYQQTKQDLQKELAAVLAEVDRVKTQLGVKAQPQPVTKPKPACPHCQTPYVKATKFCPECGKPLRIAGLLACLFLLTATAHAAVTGTVTNRTTNKPQPGATVGLYKLGTRNGLELIDQAKTDASGAFTINQTLQGPHLIRTAWDGVTYNHMLPPGQPATGLALDVYNSSKQPGAAKVDKHMILFEPSGGQLAVTETYLFTNEGKTAWNDPDSGTLKFFAPEGAGKPTVQATAPGGAPIGAPVNKTAKSDIYAVDFPVKPGETRFDVSYTLPYTEGADLAGKIVTKDQNTYLIAPSGVTLKGEGLNDLGTEPRTQAHIYGLPGNAYKIQIAGSLPPASEATPDSNESGPKIEQIMPRIHTKAPLIIGCALGILALGFALLYRRSAA